MLEGVGEWFWRILSQVGQRTGDGRQQVGKVQQVHIGSAGKQAVHNAQPDCNLLLCIISTVILVVHLFAAGYGNPPPPRQVALCVLACLIELAQLFAPPPPPSAHPNPSLAPLRPLIQLDVLFPNALNAIFVRMMHCHHGRCTFCTTLQLTAS